MRAATHTHRVFAIGVTCSVALLIVSCGNGSDSSAGGAAGSDAATKALTSVPASEFVDETGKSAITVMAKDNSFDPQYVTVSPGTKITFDNRGRNAHNVIPVEKDAFTKIPTEDLQAGAQDTLVIEKPGDYAYYCSLHGTPDKGMHGRITVAPG